MYRRIDVSFWATVRSRSSSSSTAVATTYWYYYSSDQLVAVPCATCLSLSLNLPLYLILGNIQSLPLSHTHSKNHANFLSLCVFLHLLSNSANHPILRGSQQSDQLRRNFATLAIFWMYLAIFNGYENFAKVWTNVRKVRAQLGKFSWLEMVKYWKNILVIW